MNQLFIGVEPLRSAGELVEGHLTRCLRVLQPAHGPHDRALGAELTPLLVGAPRTESRAVAGPGVGFGLVQGEQS